MRANHVLAVAVIFAVALVVAASLGADKRDIAIMTALFGGTIPVLGLDQKRRGRSGCCFRQTQAAEQAEA